MNQVAPAAATSSAAPALGRNQCDAGGNGRGDAASGREFAVRMKEEFDRKKALFEDDAAFIQEVREGHSQAVGMDPDQELRILKLRFTAFKRDFKASHLPRLMDDLILVVKPAYAVDTTTSTYQQFQRQWSAV